MDIKWVALAALVFQNSGLAVAMRYTFISSDGGRYITSTAVFIAEVMKFFISLLACFVLDADMNIQKFISLLQYELGNNKLDWLKLMVPSVLYTLQNSLQYYSMSCLSAPVFQVLYQMKIITTAVFSVLILSKRISSTQWVSVIALALGVALVQLSQSSHTSDAKTNSIAGLISVLCGCLTSGFAGVYFEMVLKSSKTSLWLRNIQLALIGIFMAAISCYMRDYEQLSQRGFYAGYNETVWIVVILQAAGGLLVAVVVKYADNVLKGFATSLSILVSCVVSMFFFHDIALNMGFIVGAGIVLTSVYAYGYSPPKPSFITSSSSTAIATGSAPNSPLRERSSPDLRLFSA